MIRQIKIWFDRQNFWIQIAILGLIIFLIRTFGFGLYQVPTGSMETTMLVGERFFADKLTLHFSPLKHGDIISFNDPNFDYAKSPTKRLWQKYVWGPSNWTKRVIGIPGDHIRGAIEDGKPVVYRNGVKLEEPYLNKYPLIAVWEKDASSQLHMLMRNEKFSYKSYDPNKPYGQQPFYRIYPQRVVTLEYPGVQLVRPPQTPLPDKSDVFDVKLGDNEYWVMGDNRLGSYDSRAWGKLSGDLIHGKILFRIWSLDSDRSWWIVDLLLHPIDFWRRVRWGRCMQVVR